MKIEHTTGEKRGYTKGPAHFAITVGSKERLMR